MLTNDQKQHVLRQLDQHDRESGTRAISLGEDTDLTLDLKISRGVFGSDIINSGFHTAGFLFEHPELYRDKNVLDMGCGAGTQGILMAENGAKHVTLVDINPKAVHDTRENIQAHGLDNATVVRSDLFQSLPNQSWDFIVFNHPFFPELPEEIAGIGDIMLARSMLATPELLEHFLSEAHDRLSFNGTVVMPYYHLAGPENNPLNKYRDFNFWLAKTKNFQSEEGIQKGDFSIYVFKKGSQHRS